MLEMEEKDLIVDTWLQIVAAKGYKNVEVDYITACYGVEDRNRYVWKLVELIPPVHPPDSN
jgi:hypothetical protein